MCNSIPVRKIQNVAFLVNGIVTQLALDSGCEGDCMREDECNRLGLSIEPLDHTDSHLPMQADGRSPLNIVGKVKCEPYRGKISLKFDGYVTKDLQSPVLCGAPFLSRNKIVQELHNRRIVVDSKYYIEETSPFCPNKWPEISVSNLSLKHSGGSFIEPNQEISINARNNIPDSEYMVTPLDDTLLEAWPPQVSTSVKGQITMQCCSKDVSFLPAKQNLFTIHPVVSASSFSTCNQSGPSLDYCIRPDIENINSIAIEETLPKSIKETLQKIHVKHAKVFDGDLRLGYNGFSGNVDVNFHFLNDVPPPINYGCGPSYNKREDDVLLQTMIDKLESLNVVARASSLNIIPKFASPCMLVKKIQANG